MDASNLTDVFQYMQSSAELRHMLMPCSIVQNPTFERPVCVQPDGMVLCQPGPVEPARAWFSARLALEVAALACAAPQDADQNDQKQARTLLAAARVTARAWRLSPFCQTLRPVAPPCTWGDVMAEDAVPSPTQLAACVADVALYVAPALRPAIVDDHALHVWACAVWPGLQPAEWLVMQGGDERLDPARQTGLNRYGCQPFPRYGELAFSSSTASTPTLPAARAIHRASVRLVRRAVDGQEGTACPVQEIKAFLASFYHMDGVGRVVLAPSGTDCALAATALMGMVSPHITTILPGVEETGSGVPLATCGRHFACRTARGQDVAKGSPIEGFPQDAEHIALPLRGEGGSRVADEALFAACQQHITRAVQAGRRVLLYVLHVSKTGQLVLPASRVRALCALYPGQVDVLVDACQARLRAEQVRQYVALGWAVMVTGSKFFTGPPFSGALLLPDCWLNRLQQGSLPTGLAAYATRAEWPDMPATRCLPEGMNAGLFLRWSGARAEMAAFAAVPDAQKYARLHQFMVQTKAALVVCPFVRLLPSVDLPEPQGADEWDSLPSIFAFVVLAHGGALDFGQTKHLHRWLLEDLSDRLPAGLSEAEQALAALPCHVGQPVCLTTAQAGVGGLGALRVSASARHVSGTEGAVLAPHHSVARVLDKLELILRFWPHLAQPATPRGAPVPPAVAACAPGQGRQGISSLALRQS